MSTWTSHAGPNGPWCHDTFAGAFARIFNLVYNQPIHPEAPIIGDSGDRFVITYDALGGAKYTWRTAWERASWDGLIRYSETRYVLTGARAPAEGKEGAVTTSPLKAKATDPALTKIDSTPPEDRPIEERIKQIMAKLCPGNKPIADVDTAPGEASVPATEHSLSVVFDARRPPTPSSAGTSPYNKEVETRCGIFHLNAPDSLTAEQFMQKYNGEYKVSRSGAKEGPFFRGPFVVVLVEEEAAPAITSYYIMGNSKTMEDYGRIRCRLANKNPKRSWLYISRALAYKLCPEYETACREAVAA